MIEEILLTMYAIADNKYNCIGFVLIDKKKLVLNSNKSYLSDSPYDSI